MKLSSHPKHLSSQIGFNLLIFHRVITTSLIE